MPKRRPNSTSPKAVKSAILRKEALALRLEGHSLLAIGEKLGISLPYAHRVVSKALRDIPNGEAEELRTLELTRLDGLQLEVMEVLRRFHPYVHAGQIVMVKDDTTGNSYPLADDSLILSSVDRLLKIQERRAKLVGLDKPEKKELTGADGSPIAFTEIQADERARQTRAAMLAQLGELDESPPVPD